MLPVLTFTIFVSAALLFMVQPMFARMVLPMLGGAPAVWNTAMVFFQACLLCGYAFAHFARSRLSPGWHRVVQCVLVLLPLAVLPMSISPAAVPPAETNPTLWLFGLMCMVVGAPFFALSTTSPTLQAWFAATSHPRARAPYFLYVASNAGSLLTLVAYPVLVEPYLSLSVQLRIWTVGYAVFGVSVVLVAFLLGKHVQMPRVEKESGNGPESATPSPSWRDRGFWVLASFAPSSLLLGVTSYISSEVAAVPLFWVVPMGLYLLTFIFAFSERRLVSDAMLKRILVPLLIPLVIVIAIGQRVHPIAVLMLLNLAVFFIMALLCHRRLAARRPEARHLTEFYLWVSVGGVLGGVFNALLAPTVFDSFAEYPLGLLLACWLAIGPVAEQWRRLRWVLGPAGVLVAAIAACMISSRFDAVGNPAVPLLSMIIPGIACFLLSRQPTALMLGLAGILAAGSFSSGTGLEVERERSFFGVSRIVDDPQRQLRTLYHGLTIHGAQSLDPARRLEPLSYYHRKGPAGEVLTSLKKVKGARVGVVGLGAGSLAAYAFPGQEWTFFEIDPVVIKYANSGRYFTFLKNAEAPVRVVPGDARLTLAKEPDGSFDLLVIDAYSSDAIPVHLVTNEAFEMYAKKLRQGGVILCHISNNHLDLEPVLGAIGRAHKWECRVNEDMAEGDVAASACIWMIMSPGGDGSWKPGRGTAWRTARACDSDTLWRDDFSSVLKILR